MPNPALDRREPQQGKNGFSNDKGFTVIELMIAIAVLAIVTSLALPSYRTIIEKRQVTSGAEQIKAFMSAAQLESVRRNQPVSVNYEWNGGSWCMGMRTAEAVADADCDCTISDPTNNDACAIDGALRVVNYGDVTYPEALQSSSSLGGADDNLVFDPVRGLILNAETANMELISDDATYALDVQVLPTGRMNVCNDTVAASSSVPRFESC
ncbi:MAG: GspH/FimT family pseudopilin [Gammaproteobacteria bacterium]|nr:GspH/FimT family pseudopilin [Gammaproteobacteria bacterium]